ncbi:hypothetical protein [Alloalcanivorax marinus]|uniref:hypothetical protein n=1 Tax=Alloalcanivorax marinus TaxID=1177169 RepID=UPI0021D1CD91|nr:hypothetical protein [Alloalcanivorax marinus]MCU5787858.1 peptidase M23B [Alloalcanivorax marinus]
MHLSELLVHASGNTGRSTGPHPHYELRLKGGAVNAMEAALPTSGPLTKDELTRFRNQHAAYFDLPEPGQGGTEVAGRAH